MENILLMLAHPRYEKSLSNKALIEAARQLPCVMVHDLYELYPDFNINVEHEHALLLQHGIIIWQYPLYMYSPPAILKQWMDLVLEHGWAHGAGGRNLENKLLLNAVTTGGSGDSYGPQGFNRYRLEVLLRPLEQTARLCRMVWLPVFTVQGTFLLGPEQLNRYGLLYRRALQRLSMRDFDPAGIRNHAFLNEWIESGEQRCAHD